MGAEYARFTLGYLWALAEPVLYVGPLLILHVFIRHMGGSAHNMTPFLFIVFGTMPWLAFMRTMYSTYRILYSNKHLLQLPGTTTLDIILSHGIVQFVTYNTMFILFVAVGVFLEMPLPPRNLLGVIVYFNSALLLGLSFGAALIPIHRVVPAIDHFMVLVARIGFWTAGLFFVIDQMPSVVWPYLTWNPMLHVSELIRASWFSVYETPVGSPTYVFGCIIGFATVGLVADRMLRPVAV